MRMTLVAIGMAAVWLCTGCAEQPPLQASDVDGKVVCHPDKVAQAESQAKRERKQLMWVNCPQAVLRTS